MAHGAKRRSEMPVRHDAEVLFHAALARGKTLLCVLFEETGFVVPFGFQNQSSPDVAANRMELRAATAPLPGTTCAASQSSRGQETPCGQRPCRRHGCSRADRKPCQRHDQHMRDRPPSSRVTHAAMLTEFVRGGEPGRTRGRAIRGETCEGVATAGALVAGAAAVAAEVKGICQKHQARAA